MTWRRNRTWSRRSRSLSVSMEFRKRKKRTEINIVPLVDVLIVLIFFFLMSMQFRNVNVLAITPPKIDSAGKEEATAPLEIAVNERGDYFLNAELASQVQVTTFFADIADLDKRPSIVILADEDSPLKAVTFLLDMARRNNVDKISLRAR